MITISLAVKTMDGQDAQDPAVAVTVFQTQPIQKPIAHVVIANFTGEVVVNVDDPAGFPTWLVTLDMTRFDADAGFWFMPGSEANPSHTFQAIRLPNLWKPQFAPLGKLPPSRFGPLAKVIARSTDVDLKNGPPPVGDLNQSYDVMAGTAQVLAKAALLNLYAVLTDELDPIGNVPWFSYVQKIVRLDQERFIAEVDPTLFENVQTILNELNSTYRRQGYFTEPPADMSLHIPNIPPAYDAPHNLVEIITVKKDYEQGNVQLTLSFLRVNGQAVHLLDCDMDENRNIVLHSFDLLKHMVSGGTSPISMHEYIVEDSAQQSANGIAIVDLGYTLV